MPRQPSLALRTDVPDSPCVGADPRFVSAILALRRAARSNSPVLITGETGTGKELAAQIVHKHSAFRGGPLLAVNCAGLPQNLIASELFGHERGAFTDAKDQKIGKIEAAANGTLFLDEIGDLPVELQGYLLRFLDKMTIERVGGNRSIVVNTRIVAATNVDLLARIADGRFREDLYYRLNFLSVHLPALRERGQDAVRLAAHYLDTFRREFGRPQLEFSDEALTAITEYDWPGNVRQLIGVISRAVVMTDADRIQASHLELPPRVADGGCALKSSVSEAKRSAIERALQTTGGNVTRASKQLGVSRITLYRLIKRFDIPLHARHSNGHAYHALANGADTVD